MNVGWVTYIAANDITQRSPAARMKVLRYETYSGYLDAHVILKPEFVQKQSVL